MTILQYLRTGALFALLTPALALAADKPIVNEKFSDLEPAIQMLRQEVGKDRREIVKANMLLTNSEAARFWPIYDEYRAEMAKLGDRRVKLITDYAANRNGMHGRPLKKKLPRITAKRLPPQIMPPRSYSISSGERDVTVTRTSLHCHGAKVARTATSCSLRSS